MNKSLNHRYLMQQNKKIFLVCQLCLIAAFGFSQEIKVNEKGEKIKVYQDGTWIKLSDTDELPDQKKGIASKPEKTAAKQTDTNQQNKKTEQPEAGDYFIKKKYRQDLEDELKQVRNMNAPNNDAFIDAIKAKIKEAKKEEKIAYKAYQKSKNKTTKSAPSEPVIATKQPEEKTKNKEKKPTGKPAKTVETAEEKNVAEVEKNIPESAAPTVVPCKLALDETSQKTGTKTKETEFKNLFSFTPAPLRSYFQNRDFMDCRSSISLAADQYFLNLEIRFHSANAVNSYGNLAEGSFLDVRFINGENLRLLNQDGDPGKADREKDEYRYHARYLLDKSAVKALRKNELDKIRIFWSSGFEDYEVHHLDFFKDHFSCLDANI